MTSAFARLLDNGSGQGTLDGTPVGNIERRYGLLRSTELVSISHALEAHGDLAVADRMAFLHATQARTQLVVVQLDRRYWVVVLDRAISPEQAADLQALEGAPRIMSLVSERGITPIVAPLVR